MRPVVYILGLAALSCAWTAAGSSLLYWLVLGAAVLASTHRGLDRQIVLRLVKTAPRPAPASIGIGIGLVAAAPPLVLLARTLGQEFPFVGDHDHHLFQAEWSYRLLRFAFVPLVAAVVLLAWRPRRAVAVAVAIALFAASQLPFESTMFATRYPGLDHFTIFPLNALSHLTGIPSPPNVMRIEHALAVPVWLFLLRPYVLGRWPDAWALGAALGFVWPAAAAYHFTTAYLEAPMLVLVALAVEASLHGEGATGRRAALLFLGAAAVFKEQAIFALPVMALAALVADGTREERRETLRVAGISFVPSLLYFVARMHAAVWRGAGLLPLDRIVDPGRVTQWTAGAARAYGPTALLLAGAVLVAILVVRRERITVLGWAAVIAVENGFFYVDSVSEPWTGYARFLLLPAVVAAALGAEVLACLGPRARAAGLAVLACAALPTLGPLLVKSGADTARNFYEHGDAPIFLPVRRGAELLPPETTRVRIISGTGLLVPKYSIYALVVAYPDLTRRLAWDLPRPGDFDSAKCECAGGEPPRLALFVVFDNRAAAHPLRAEIEAAQISCKLRMEETCGAARAIASGDALWGMVGVPR